MGLHNHLRRFIKVGTLNLIDSQGKTYRYTATPSSEITIQLHSKGIERQFYRSPFLRLRGRMHEWPAYSGEGRHI